MELADWLSQKKQEIVREWIRATMEAYPAEALNILKKNNNRFANPLPHIISTNIERLFEDLLLGIDSERTSPILAEIVKVRAVQDFPPSKALHFIFDLKKILEKMQNEKAKADDKPHPGQLSDFIKEIDELAMLAFDIYVQCKEKLYEIRANEIRNQTHMLIRRVNEMDQQKEAR